MECRRLPFDLGRAAIPRGLAMVVLCGVSLPGIESCARSRVTRSPLGRQALAASTSTGDAYYRAECALCSGLLGYKGEALEYSHEGRNLRFCSSDCLARFVGAPEPALARIDRILIEDQRPHYPLPTSIVSARPLGSSPVDFVWRNRLVRVAREEERQEFLASPRDFMQRLDAATIDAQRPTYGMPTKCPVQGDILSSDTPIDLVIGGRMIRVCCERCAAVVRRRPQQYLALVDRANAQRRADE